MYGSQSRVVLHVGRYTGSEAATIVQNVSGPDRVEARWRLRASYSRRVLVPVFGVQRECLYPKVAKDMNHVKLAVVHWSETWDNKMRCVANVGAVGELHQRCQKAASG